MVKNIITDEAGNGAEIVEIVIGIVCSIGLGAALIAFQQQIKDAITNNTNTMSTLFSNLNSAAL